MVNRYYLLGMLIIAGMALACLLYFNAERQSVRQRVAEELSAIVRLKAEEIERWRANQRIEGAGLAQRPMLIGRFVATVEDPQEDHTLWLKEILTPLLEQEPYEDIMLTDSEGMVRWSVTGSASPVSPEGLKYIAQAIRERQVVLSDFYSKGPGAGLGMMVVAPLYRDNLPDSEAVGAAVLHLDVERSLYAMLQAWPAPSDSAEFVLVRREGDHAQLLSPLRHGSEAPGDVRIPLSDLSIIAPQNILKGGGFFEGRDYRDAKVVAVGHPVRNSPWFLQAQMEQAEAYAESGEHAMLFTALLVAVAALFFAGTMLLLREKQREVIVQLNEALEERQRLTQLYRLIAETDEQLLRAKTEEEIFEGLVKVAVGADRFKFAWVGIPGPDGAVEPIARAGEDEGYIDQIHATIHADDPRGQGPTGQVFRSGETLTTRDFMKAAATKPWRDAAARAGITASVTLPIYKQDKVYATLNLYAGKDRRLSDDIITALKNVAMDVSLALSTLAVEVERSKLLDSLRVLQTVVESSRTVLFRWGVTEEWPVTFVSNNVSQWGYAQEDILSGTVSFAAIIHPDDLQRVGRELEAYLREGRTSYTQTYRILKADGEPIWIEDHTTIEGDASSGVRELSGTLTDINDRVHAELALQESEARLQLALSATGQGIWDLNLVTGEAVITPAYETMLGYAPGELVETQTTWMDRLHPDDTAATVRAFDECIAGKLDQYRVEFRLRCKDGYWKWIRSVGKVVDWDEHGKPIRILGVHTDIDGVRHAEEERKKSEFEYQTLFREMLDGFAISEIICDEFARPMDYRFLAVNPAFERLTGLKAEAVVNRTALEVLPGLEPVWIERFGQVALSGEPDAFEEYSSTLGKHYSVSVFQSGEGRFACLFVDITERKKAEAELLESQQRLALTIESAELGTFDWDLTKDYHIWNPRHAEMFGITLEEYDGTYAGFERCVHPEDRTKIAEGVSKSRMERSPFSQQFRVVWPDESIHWLSARGRFIYDEATGEATHMRGVVTEVTDQHNLEEEFRQAQRMESIGRLAGGVAHDFNNLLSVIGGYTEMAISIVAEDDALHHDLEQVKRAADRAANLTRQLLAFSRRQVLRPEVLCLNTVVTDTEKMLRRLVGEDINLITELDESLGETIADPGQIEQVLMNLVVNARDAMPFGGTLAIRTSNQLVRETLQVQATKLNPGPYVMLSVMDSGIGMDEPTLQRIFEPFFTTKEQGKGTGLGLAMVFGILQQSGGAVMVESKLGQGTTFKLYLPQVYNEVFEAKSEAPLPTPHGTESILLVEDDEFLRELGERFLSGFGYTVSTAASGAEALAVFEALQEKPALLLTDVIMPGMSGAQLANELQSRDPALRVLFISGYTDDAISQHGVLNKGTHLLNKPFTRAELATAVRSVLDEDRPV